MTVLHTFGLFVVTAVAEIVGCYLPYLWLKKSASPWVLLPAAASLAFFAWLLSLHPTAAGRVYAAYGGVYVSVALVWLWLVDGVSASCLGFCRRGRDAARHEHHHVRAPGWVIEVGTGQFDSRFGNRTGVRKPDSKLSRFDARYPVLLQTRHPRPVPGNQG
jgi:small multidrug resistance family-3 protein